MKILYQSLSVSAGSGRAVLVVLFSWLVSSCSTVSLPLCPRIAGLSYEESDASKSEVNKYVVEAIRARNISMMNVGPFEAEYKGSWREITWLEKNYPALLCAFSPSRVIDPTAVHTACMDRAPGWISVVKSGRIDNLFLDSYGYKSSCYPRVDGS